MKIVLINGSPKTIGSASEVLLNDLKSMIHENHDFITIELHHQVMNEFQLEDIANCDVLVFAFPMYMAGIPSHLLPCLIQLEEALSAAPRDITVYAIINNAHLEGIQNDTTIEMMKNWCNRAHLKWGQGMGIGGGVMLSEEKEVPMGRGPKKYLGHAYTTFVNNLLERKTGEDLYVNPNYPKFVYVLGGNHEWNKQAKAHGLKKKDLSIAP